MLAATRPLGPLPMTTASTVSMIGSSGARLSGARYPQRRPAMLGPARGRRRAWSVDAGGDVLAGRVAGGDRRLAVELARPPDPAAEVQVDRRDQHRADDDRVEQHAERDRDADLGQEHDRDGAEDDEG